MPVYTRPPSPPGAQEGASTDAKEQRITMSETPNPVTPADTSPEGKAPEFEGDFDAEKAKRLVANLRGEVAALTTERDSFKTDLDSFKEAAEKTGVERETALAAAIERAATAEREVALAKHDLPEDVLKDFADYLTGTPEEVEAKATKLAARFKKVEETVEPTEEAPKAAPVTRPKAALVPGNGDDAPKAFDAKAIAEKARG